MKARFGLVLALMVVMACGLCACGSQASSSSSTATESASSASSASGSASASSSASTSSSAQESTTADSDDPYVGTYFEEHAGRGTITVEKDETSDLYLVSVAWPSSAAEVSEWTFSGEIDADGTLEYYNCLMVTMKDGEDPIEDYESGTGRLMFGEDGLTWEDDQDNVADDALFVRA